MPSAAAHGQVRWREVIFFSLIAYALTWGWNAIWILPHLGVLTASTTPIDPAAIYGNLLNFLPGMFGPLIAAVVMRLWVSREGLRGSLGLRRPWPQYALALVAPIAFIAVLAGVILLTGLGHLKPQAEPPAIAIVPLLALLLVLEAVLGFGEEYGWRGYLLPRLMPLGEVPGTLVLGLIWWPWHLPVLITGVILGGNSLWLIVPIHFCLVVLGSFPYTWLAKATGYSPALAAIFHGGSNWAGQRLLAFFAFSSALLGVVAMGVGWLIVVLAWYGVRWFRVHGVGPAAAPQ
jgi:membrane protease YdiL (CAAX protease family)